MTKGKGRQIAGICHTQLRPRSWQEPFVNNKPLVAQKWDEGRGIAQRLMSVHCELAHRQIKFGPCPWCRRFVVDHDVVSTPERRDTNTRHWDYAEINGALDDDSEHVRQVTTCHLSMLECSDIGNAIPLFSKVVNDRSLAIQSHGGTALFRLGRKVSKIPGETIRMIEKRFSLTEHELAVRALLLVCYKCKCIVSPSPSNSTTWERHASWIIVNAPESILSGSPSLRCDEVDANGSYSRLKKLWLKQVFSNPRNATILGNAAEFFVVHDKGLSEDLLERARSLETPDSNLCEQLAHHYALSNPTRAYQELKAADDVVFYQRSRTENVGPIDIIELRHLFLLHKLAKLAFNAGEFDDARRYAMEALEASETINAPGKALIDGLLVFYGNLILGRCVLKNGDVERAKRYLIAAGHTQGSPTLNSFGPNMSLAKELLEVGEKDAVLEFLRLCGMFWQGRDKEKTLGEWAAEVRQGEIPDFGANLHY